MQIITKQVNGVEISFKVSDDKKNVWVLLDDNFALAEGFISLRAMFAQFLYSKNERPIKVSKSNDWSRCDAEGYFSLVFARQSKVIQEIVNEIKNP